jgi:recombination protein RecT
MQTKAIAKNSTNAVTVKNVTDDVLNKIKVLEKGGNIFFPPNYSPENALKSAWLKLQTTEDRNHKKALEVCTYSSIANALLDMVVQGLTPAKNQCYFIVYGKELQLSRSYMGTVAVTKRLKGVKDVFANVIYKDDIFEYRINIETGLKEIVKHEQDFKNINPDKIAGAYAIVVRGDAPNYIEVMNFEQIKKAWGQGATKGGSPAHKNFPEEMAKKSVINRACKMFFNTSDDSDILIDAINRTTEAEYTIENAEDAAQIEIEENANTTEIDFTEEAPASSEPSKEEQEKILAKELAEAEQEGLDF